MRERGCTYVYGNYDRTEVIPPSGVTFLISSSSPRFYSFFARITKNGTTESHPSSTTNVTAVSRGIVNNACA